MENQSHRPLTGRPACYLVLRMTDSGLTNQQIIQTDESINKKL